MGQQQNPSNEIFVFVMIADSDTILEFVNHHSHCDIDNSAQSLVATTHYTIQQLKKRKSGDCAKSSLIVSYLTMLDICDKARFLSYCAASWTPTHHMIFLYGVVLSCGVLCRLPL